MSDAMHMALEDAEAHQMVAQKQKHQLSNLLSGCEFTPNRHNLEKLRSNSELGRYDPAITCQVDIKPHYQS